MLVPYFIGVIIYLIVRQQPSSACPACGQRTVPGAAYCPHCGQSTKATCAGCTAAMPGGARYCPACGLAAAAA